VGDLAFNLGYQSTSAFIAMFRLSKAAPLFHSLNHSRDLQWLVIPGIRRNAPEIGNAAVFRAAAKSICAGMVLVVRRFLAVPQPSV
jgi:hypothetical protein